ncbi:MAG: tetratricopeptide repeat protein [Gemmatimonadaceae bacterium]
MQAPTILRDAEVLRAWVERIDQADPHAFNNLGVLYHSKGMHTEAVDAFLRAIALEPRMQTAVRNLEVAAAVDGACDAHLSALAERIACDAEDRDAARAQARLLRLIGRHAEAVQKLDALIAENPDDAPALRERGLLEQRNGDLRRAQRWFERASNADEVDTLSRLHLAEVLYQRGQNEQALSALDDLLLLDDELADAHLLRGFVLGDMGRHEAGMQAARRASALNPSLTTAQANLSLEKTPASGSYPAIVPGATALLARATSTLGLGGVPVMGVVPTGELARYSLGLAFRQRGYFAEARREFERALTQNEDERFVRHAIAELDLIAGNHIGAAQGYEALFAKYGESARWRNEHGVAMHQHGAVALAAESYRRALRCDPRYALAYANLGVALADMGEGAAAREALQQAASIDPTFVRARLNLARLHAQQRDPLASLSLLRELSTFHSSHADVWHEMGLVLVTLHRPDDARRAFIAALENRGDHAEARYALGRVLHELGDAEGASRETLHAQRLSSIRAPSRLTVGIELQQECPDAVGTLDLLALHKQGSPADATLQAEPSEPLLPAENAATDQAPLPLDVFGGASGSVSVQVLFGEADGFAARSMHGEALECYRRARQICDRGDSRFEWRRAALGEARCQCLLGRGGEALDLLDKLLFASGTSDEADAEVLALLAAAHTAEWKKGKVEPRNARAAIARFLRLEPRSAALLHFVGDVATDLQENDLALVLFRRALAVDPMRPTPRVAIARLLRQRDNVLAARLELVAALAVAPQLRDALLELARLHCGTGRAVDALPILVGHLNRVPADTDALALLAKALLSVGRENDARLAVTRALRLDPSHAEALELEGTLRPDHDQSHQARENVPTLQPS